ncbi:glycosyltransferase family 4 protein [Enterococcus sp. S86.2]|uniref:glycosyltransferase family 4 protein n=1 Tax=Enterococcus sp. S86.2 TaxID=3031299 RepID=UPI0026EEF89A|nr:glycosyltransferase family 4 protein [Enterococcus sp. S86.2]
MESKLRNIWIFNHYANEMWKNMGGRHYSFAENLTNLGYNVTIFCASSFHNQNNSIEMENRKYKIDSSRKFSFVFIKTPVAIGNGLKRIKNMYSFYHNLLLEYKLIAHQIGVPDLIIASSVHPLTLVAGIKIAKKFKIPCICEIRDLWPEAIFSIGKTKENSLIGKLLIKGEHWIYKNADALIFTKEGDIDYLNEKGWLSNQGGDVSRDKCFYINNGVNIHKFNEQIVNEITVDSDLDSEKFKVVYCGAIRPVNNVEKIVNAAKVLKDNKKIIFLIYGEGNEKKHLENLVKNYGLTNIKFKGFIEKSKIPYILHKSDLNILNYSQTQYNWSRGNSSNKLFEYLASGKPVLSTVEMGYSIIEKYQCGTEIYDASSEEIASEIISYMNLSKVDYEQKCENAKNAAEEFDYSKRLTPKLLDVMSFSLKNKLEV